MFLENNNLVMKEILNDCKEKYAKVKKLLEEESKNDSPSEPYMSKYKAKSILIDMCKLIENILPEISTSEFTDITKKSMLGAILLQIGIIDMETEDLTNSELVLVKAETLLAEHSLEAEVINVLLNVYNNLGILWSNRDQPEKAKNYLLKAKEFYENFKCTMKVPISIDCLFGITEDNNIYDYMMFEKSYTLTLYYLAQVFGALKCELKSAIYCHITLKRQLQYNDYDPIDWALNSATLSQFFAVQNGFFQSRHHLAAASIILERYEQELQQTQNDSEQYQAKLETFRHRSADIALCWVKYCLNLMTSSKNRLMNDGEESSSTVTGE